MLDYTSSNHISIWFCLIHIQSFVSVNFFFIPRPCASKFLKFMDFVFAKEELLVPRSGCHYIHNLERGWRNLPKTKKSICSEHTQSGGDHSPSQCAHLFAGWVGAGGLGWLLLRVTVGWSVLILFCLIPAKAKKIYEQKCRDKDEAEQAVHRSANMANPKQQEKVPRRANSLKNPRFTYVELELINNLNDKKKWTCTLSFWQYPPSGY